MHIKDFDEATEHSYDCQCELCQEWWEKVGPEREGDLDDLEDSDIAF